MIVEMAKLRILGPRRLLTPTLLNLQDLGVLHLARVAEQGRLAPSALSSRQLRLRRQLHRMDADLSAAQAALQCPPARARAAGSPFAGGLPAVARLAQRVRRNAEALAAQLQALGQERALLLKYKDAFLAFGPLLRPDAARAGLRAYYAVVLASQAPLVPKVRALLSQVIGDGFELRSRPLPGGDTALLILAPTSTSTRVEKLLGESGVAEMPVPRGYEAATLSDALPRMMERLALIPAERDRALSAARSLRDQHAAALALAVAVVEDALAELAALELSGVTERAFVLEGWVPRRLTETVTRGIAGAPDAPISVTQIERGLWADEAVPVVLQNPRIFRPFELLITLLPLPRYGSIDPTPFTAVFFPMFFGLMVGDIGYGLLLAALAFLLHRGSAPDSRRRAIAEIATACALFSTVFGFLFGELFGNLGHDWFGMHPILLDREHQMKVFLILVIGLGTVHVLLGLFLGVVNAFRHSRREALGKGLSMGMVVLIIVALLAALRTLPHALLTPTVIILLAVFPVLVAVEGLVAPVELLSTLGTILSYARIMALGTASVMLALVANRLSGAFGSALVGIVFALLFHLVNFALGLFSPTIHALRLHYVEFFGRFYSPGGAEYRPFGHGPHSAHRAA